MSTSRAFLRGIVDYAGLFPPASLSMPDAVRAYADYLGSDERDLLGRFIVPVSRLSEFASALAAEPLQNGDEAQWRLSVIVPADDAGVEAIANFNRSHSNPEHARAVIDCVEIPLATRDQALRAIDTYAKSFELYLEPSPLDRADEILSAIAGSGAGAKIRTGGVISSAVPPAERVIAFIGKCGALGVRFKATAGLHHALHGSFPLTYETNAAAGTMFGYLNVFLVAAFHRAGLPESALLDLLEEFDPASISFDEEGAHWRGNLASVEDLESTRSSFAMSFGSCSFTEPVAEARELNLL